MQNFCLGDRFNASFIKKLLEKRGKSTRFQNAKTSPAFYLQGVGKILHGNACLDWFMKVDTLHVLDVKMYI